MERKRQAKTARPTATETCGRGHLELRPLPQRAPRQTAPHPVSEPPEQPPPPLGPRASGSDRQTLTRNDCHQAASPASRSPGGGKLPRLTLTPKGVSSFFSTGSPEVLFVSVGTQGGEWAQHTWCLLQQLPPPPPLSPLPGPRLQGPDRTCLPSCPGYSPTGEKETAVGGGEKAVRWRPESREASLSHSPRPGLIPSWDGAWGGGGGAAGPQGGEAPGPSPAAPTRWCTALSSASPGRGGSPGLQGSQGSAEAGQGGQRRAGLQNPRLFSAQDQALQLRSGPQQRGGPGEEGRVPGLGWPLHREWGPQG